MESQLKNLEVDYNLQFLGNDIDIQNTGSHSETMGDPQSHSIRGRHGVLFGIRANINKLINQSRFYLRVSEELRKREIYMEPNIG